MRGIVPVDVQNKPTSHITPFRIAWDHRVQRNENQTLWQTSFTKIRAIR